MNYDPAFQISFLITQGVDTLALVLTAIVPAYLAFKVRDTSLRILSLLLLAFVISHASFHVANLFQALDLAWGVIQPVSVLLLLAFGLHGLKRELWPYGLLLVPLAPGGVAFGIAVTLWGLVVSLAVFVILAATRRNPDVSRMQSLRFGLSIAALVWIVGEVLYLSGEVAVGGIVHAVAMMLFLFFIFGRSRRLFGIVK